MENANNRYPKVILASASPRRHELLTKMGVPFEVCVADVDETISGKPEEMVKALAMRKARAVAQKLQRGIVVGADTLVAIDGQALGKPQDENDARRMLNMLSGREHEVFTGVAVVDMDKNTEDAFVTRTGIHFFVLTPETIEKYIGTGEPMGKAGAYAVQGGAGAFVEKMDGSFENVMGFPVQDFAAFLQKKYII